MSGYFYTIIDKGKTTESSPANKGTYITRKKLIEFNPKTQWISYQKPLNYAT